MSKKKAKAKARSASPSHGGGRHPSHDDDDDGASRSSGSASAESEAEDYSQDEDEGADGYKPGGYHPVEVGDVYNSRYLVLKKLGWGHFSTVWLVEDEKGRELALKVQKSASHYTEAAWDEIKLLRAAQEAGDARMEGGTFEDPHVVELVDYFQHDGPHGTHVCMVFEPLGENLLHAIKLFDYRGLPIAVVKEITFQVRLRCARARGGELVLVQP